MEVTVCKIPLEDGSGFFRLEVEWSTDRFRVVIFHTETVWTGKVTVEEIKSLSNCLSMNVKDYMRETRQALSSQGGAEEFSYAIENERFLWKKLIDNDAELKIKFGSVLLEEVPPFEMFECMLDAVIDANHQLLSQVKTLEQGRQQSETEKQELLRKLTQYQKEKIEMEETLYSNFLDILNAKKKRIRMLEKHIDTHQLTVGTSKQGTSTSSKTIVFESDTDPDDPRVEVGDLETKPLRLPMISDRTRPIIEDSDSDASPPTVFPKRTQQTKRKSKTSLVSISTTSKRKEPKSNSIVLPDLSLDQPSTSGRMNTPKVEEISHYDSETDVDQCTDDENVGSLKVTAKPMDICMDNLFDDIRKPAPTCTLPKRMRRQPIPDSSENILPALQAMSTVGTKPSGSASNQERRKFNTQELLDELMN